MWEALDDIAAEKAVTISELIDQIDWESRATNLSSAIRCYIVTYYRAKASAQR